MEQIVLERIQILIGYRRWIKRLIAKDPARSAVWKPLDTEYRAELLALVKLARQARKAEAATFVDHPANATWTQA